MYLSILSLKSFHSKRLGFRCFGHFGVARHRNYSGILARPLIIPKNSVATDIKYHKYFQRLLKKSKINDFEILKRSLSTSSRLFNKEKDPENKDSGPKIKKEILIIWVLVHLFLLLLYNNNGTDINENTTHWEEFKHEMLAKGEVKKLYLDYEGQVLYIELQEGAIVKQKKAAFHFYKMVVPEVKKFEEKLREAEKELGISPQESVPITYLNRGFGPLLLTGIIDLIFLYLLFNSKGSFKALKPELWGFRKAKFTLVDPLTGKGKGVKFSDVAGLKEAKTEIMDFVDYLKRPEVYRSLGAKVPKGALLLGPPGCGKTLLAKAVATEANVPFLSMNGSEFIEIIGGLGAARVRDLFKEAKKRIPCIIYIDEIDAIGKKREAQANFGVGELEQTLNQLLVEMDGVLSNQGVVLLASTNRADVLDAALLRPGRFDRKILIDLPTLKEREEIFEQHLKSISLEHNPEYYSKRMAHLTPGFSGADIANVCNEAALHAARTQKEIVQGEDLEYAVERVVGGTEKRSSALSPEEKKMLAYYEAGRALIGWLSKYGEALLKITIVSRTDSPAGWTHFSPIDKHLHSQEDLKGKMCMGLGGRVAVLTMFNRVTTAGEKDLKKVTRLAYAQVREYGMNSNVGLMSFDIGDTENSLKKPYSKALGSVFDQEARVLLREAHKEAEEIILQHKDKLIKLAEELLAKETLNYDDVVKLLGPPLFKGKKLVEPLEFDLSLDQAAGPEPDTTTQN